MQILLIGVGWILAFVFSLLFVFTNTIVYNADNQICQVPFRLSFLILCTPWFVYVIPVNLVIFIYMKLVRFVREMSEHVTPANTLTRAQRDLKIVRRIVILTHILFVSGFLMTLLFVLSLANVAPKYHFRFGFLFVDASILFVMIALYQFSDPLKNFVRKKILRQRTIVVSALQ